MRLQFTSFAIPLAPRPRQLLANPVIDSGATKTDLQHRSDPVRLSADKRGRARAPSRQSRLRLDRHFRAGTAVTYAAVAESSRSAIFLAEEVVIVYAPVRDSRPSPGPASVMAH
jgi:hypothetical protein